MKKSRSFLIVILMIFPLVFNTGCESPVSPRSVTGFYFDTIIQITVYNEEDLQYARGCLLLCENYEALFSRTVLGSDIYNINHADGQSVSVDEETSKLLTSALSYCRITDGKIDLTVAPLSELWNFSENAGLDNALLPSDEAVKEALTHVDYETLVIEGETVTLNDPLAGIDPGFIAKGYIGDRLASYLTSSGVNSAIINLGGNITVLGNRPDGKEYTIGIQMPFEAEGSYITTVSLHDQSIATCGVYERCFYVDGQLYHHILNTNTGYPLETDILSVSVISSSSSEADALSTTLMTLGVTDGLKLLQSYPDTRAIFITEDYEIIDSSDL